MSKDINKFKDGITVTIKLRREEPHISFTFLIDSIIQKDFYNVLYKEISSKNLTGLFRLYYDNKDLKCFTQKIQELQFSITDPRIKIWNHGLVPTFKILIPRNPKKVDVLIQNSFSEKLRLVDLEKVLTIEVKIWFKER